MRQTNEQHTNATEEPVGVRLGMTSGRKPQFDAIKHAHGMNEHGANGQNDKIFVGGARIVKDKNQLAFATIDTRNVM